MFLVVVSKHLEIHFLPSVSSYSDILAQYISKLGCIPKCVHADHSVSDSAAVNTVYIICAVVCIWV